MMMMIKLMYHRLIIFFVAAVTVPIVTSEHVRQYAPVVNITTGLVRGVVQRLDEGTPVYAYIGIRYGQAARFAKPTEATDQPMTSSKSDVYNATHFRFACPQHSIPYSDQYKFIPGLKTGVANEDCLYLSVWTPVPDIAPSTDNVPFNRLPQMTNKSVIVWIHGGGFIEGSTFYHFYSGRYIAAQGDVVVVGINYRLDVFGFLYGGGDSDAPGNVGQHDQVLALEWVQKNIQNFGGDPSRVTVVGESAGSISVGALILSPLAKGLFHRAIMMSGAPSVYHGAQTIERALQVTKSLGVQLSCPTDTMVKLVNCLRHNKTAPEILEASSGKGFAPIYGEPLLPIEPTPALKSGQFNHDIDLMYGVVQNEGSKFITQYIDPASDGKDLTIEKVKKIIQQMFGIFNDAKISAKIAEFYTRNLHNESDKDALRQAVAYAQGDYQLVCPTIFFGETIASSSLSSSLSNGNGGKHFYSYRLTRSIQAPAMSCSGWMGVCHGQDVFYLFGQTQVLRGTVYTDEESKFSQQFIQFFTNFVKYGQPNSLTSVENYAGPVQWTDAMGVSSSSGSSSDSSSLSNTTYTDVMLLDPRNFTMKTNFYREVCNTLWKPIVFV